MKKKFNLTLLLSSFAMLFVATSCKKGYSCSCTYAGSTETYLAAQYENTSKKSAEKLCTAIQDEYNQDAKVKASCSVK